MIEKDNIYALRSLSSQESRVVLTLVEQKQREVSRSEIIQILGISWKAADHVIHSLRKKGWFELTFQSNWHLIMAMDLMKKI